MSAHKSNILGNNSSSTPSFFGVSLGYSPRHPWTSMKIWISWPDVWQFQQTIKHDCLGCEERSTCHSWWGDTPSWCNCFKKPKSASRWIWHEVSLLETWARHVFFWQGRWGLQVLHSWKSIPLCIATTSTDIWLAKTSCGVHQRFGVRNEFWNTIRLLMNLIHELMHTCICWDVQRSHRQALFAPTLPASISKEPLFQGCSSNSRTSDQNEPQK